MSTFGNSEHGKEWARLRLDHANRIKLAELGPLQRKKALAFYLTIHWEGGTTATPVGFSRVMYSDMDPIRQAEAVTRITAAWERVGWSLDTKNFKTWAAAMDAIVPALKAMRPQEADNG